MRLLTCLTTLLLALAVSLGAAPVAAQMDDLDSVKADAAHHKVEFENDQVRVVRYKIAPGDTTANHSNPSFVNVPLTDIDAKFTTPDGKSTEVHIKAGTIAWRTPTTHVVQNIGDKPIEGIMVVPKKPSSALPGVQDGVQSRARQQASEEAAVRKLSELQFHQGHNLTCLAGAHETGDSKQGASVSLVKFDPGCIIPWHWHTPNENVMVVDGALLQEWKDRPSSVAKRGDFIHIPSHQVNQAMCVSDAPCMILLYSDGKWDMHFVDASGKEIAVDEAVAAATKKRVK